MAQSASERVQAFLEQYQDRYGLHTTSTMRSSDENRRVGGVSNSQHLDHIGTARDFRTRDRDPAEVQERANELRAMGFEVVTKTHGTGPHMHVELPKGGLDAISFPEWYSSDIASNRPQVPQNASGTGNVQSLAEEDEEEEKTLPIIPGTEEAGKAALEIDQDLMDGLVGTPPIEPNRRGPLPASAPNGSSLPPLPGDEGIDMPPLAAPMGLPPLDGADFGVRTDNPNQIGPQMPAPFPELTDEDRARAAAYIQENLNQGVDLRTALRNLERDVPKFKAPVMGDLYANVMNGQVPEEFDSIAFSRLQIKERKERIASNESPGFMAKMAAGYYVNVTDPLASVFQTDKHFKPEEGFSPRELLRQGAESGTINVSMIDKGTYNDLLQSQSTHEFRAIYANWQNLNKQEQILNRGGGFSTLAASIISTSVNPIYLPTFFIGGPMISGARAAGAIGRTTLAGTTASSQIARLGTVASIEGAYFSMARAGIGETTTVADVINDVAIGGIAGAGLGVALGQVSPGIRRAIQAQSEMVAEAHKKALAQAAGRRGEYHARAAEELGQDALNKDALNAKVSQYELEDIQSAMRVALADIPDADKIIVAITDPDSALASRYKELDKDLNEISDIDARNKRREEARKFREEMNNLSPAEQIARTAREISEQATPSASTVDQAPSVSTATPEAERVPVKAADELPVVDRASAIVSEVERRGSNFKLPEGLSKATPRVGKHSIKFADDLDHAAYVLASDATKTASKAARKYRDALRAQGLDPDAVAEYGRRLKDALVRISRKKKGKGPIDTARVADRGVRFTTIASKLGREEADSLAAARMEADAAQAVSSSAETPSTSTVSDSIEDAASSAENVGVAESSTSAGTGQAGEAVNRTEVDTGTPDGQPSSSPDDPSSQTSGASQDSPESSTSSRNAADEPDEVPMSREEIIRKYDIHPEYHGMADLREAFMFSNIRKQAEKGEAENKAIQESNTLAGKLTPKYKGALGVLNPIATKIASSKSTTLRWAAAQLFERPTGSVGKATAALTKFSMERIFMGNASDIYTKALSAYAKAQGKNAGAIYANKVMKEQFDKDLFHYRALKEKGAPEFENHPLKDIFDEIDTEMDRAYTWMAEAQRKAKTPGWENLPESSAGHTPWRVHPEKWMKLTRGQQLAYTRRTVDEIVEANPEIGRREAEGMAYALTDSYTLSATGNRLISHNPFSSRASKEIEEAINRMDLSDEAKAQLLGKYKKGQMNHTKHRLSRDITSKFTDEDGNTFMLLDIMEHDTLTLLSSQASRVSGEVSMAQYGVKGMGDVDIIRAMATREHATKEELDAFDQGIAELLGQPVNGHVPGQTANMFASAMRLLYLGGLVFAQVAETVNMIPAVGFGAVMRTMADSPRLAREAKMLARGEKVENSLLGEMDQIFGNIGSDQYRFLMPVGETGRDFNVNYSSANLSTLHKIINFGEQVQQRVTFFNYVLAAQQRGVTEAILHKAADFVRRGTNDKALNEMGITKELSEKMKLERDVFEFDAEGRLVGFYPMRAKDASAVRDFTQAVRRGGGQIFQETFVGEAGSWVHNDLWRLMLTFRSYLVNAIQKQTVRSVNTHGAWKTAGMLAGASTMVLPIMYARAITKTIGMTDDEREEYMEKNLSWDKVAFMSLSYTAVGSPMADALSVPLAALGADVGSVRMGGRSSISQVSPFLGLAETVWNAPADFRGRVNRDGERVHDFQNVKRLIPFQSMIWTAPVLNSIEEALE